MNDVKEILTNEEAKENIILMFEAYNKRKKDHTLYQKNDITPVVILKMYFAYVEKRDYGDIFNTFRKKYIYNENKNEDVHEKFEREGMGIVYDYIHDFDDYKNLSIYTLLTLHSKLYSKAPYPEFGGKFRNEELFLPNTGMDLSCWEDIPKQINELYPVVDELIKLGTSLKDSNDVEKLLNYINRCIALKCKLIKIHPFKDGNGRSVRAFINLLLKIAAIPPVYIKVNERTEYHLAMNKANCNNDYNDIITFYYYKICDSILELDVKNVEKEEKTDQKRNNR